MLRHTGMGSVATLLASLAAQTVSAVRDDGSSSYQIAQLTEGQPWLLAQAPARQAIQLLNDRSTQSPVQFLLEGQVQSLEAGQSVQLPAGRPLSIEFDTGGPVGDLQFTLYEGLYKFKVTDDGWMLYKSTAQPQAAAAGQRAAGVPAPPNPSDDLAHRRRSTAASAPRPGQTAPASGAAATPAPPSAGVSATRRSPAAAAPSATPAAVATPAPPSAELQAPAAEDEAVPVRQRAEAETPAPPTPQP
ncbi:MAG: hypothetical protein KF774_18390 [Planctomyces sp.]|nr:hypothetical protein [Planctomyces sp.]